MTRTISRAGLDVIVEFEQLEPEAYRDPVGLLTIGVGHLLTPAEKRTGMLRIGGTDMPWREGLTEELCYALLDQDCDVAERAVNGQILVPLAQGQFDALVVFTFNVGPGALAGSTLRRRLNAGDYVAVPAQMRRWVKAGGKTLRGLVRRREAEIRLWEGR